MKRFDLSRDLQVEEAQNKLDRMIYAKRIIEINEVKNTRSNRQNSALYLFFTQLAEQLNEIGQSHHFTGYDGKPRESRWDKDLVKKKIWVDIQETLFGFTSTTKLDTEKINMILDVLTKHYAELGMPIKFPNQFNRYLEKLDI